LNKLGHEICEGLDVQAAKWGRLREAFLGGTEECCDTVFIDKYIVKI
jgi:hypothetical protein